MTYGLKADLEACCGSGEINGSLQTWAGRLSGDWLRLHGCPNAFMH